MTDANEIRNVLAFVFTVLGSLSIIFAIAIWAMNKIGEQQGGLSEKAMMGCIAAAVGFFAVSALVATIDFNYKP